MNQLVNSSATKEQIKDWAYTNRITVNVIDLQEEFADMKNSVFVFMESDVYEHCKDEFERWDKFLDAEFVS